VDRIDAFLSIRASRAWLHAQVVELADGSWRLFLSPGHVGILLAAGGPVDPLKPRARFHEARAALKRLVAEHSATSR
jgi:hypothetical protein